VLVFVIPALHSIQYLLFVGKLSHSKDRERVRQGGDSKLMLFVSVGAFAGAMSFWGVPFVLDRVVPYDRDVFGSTMFMMMFYVFINVHHYFIDFAIWRKDNPDMKYLYQ